MLSFLLENWILILVALVSGAMLAWPALRGSGVGGASVGTSEAVRLINPRVALAQHFNTFPPIRQDGKAWADRVCKDLRVEVPFLQPGEAANV